MTFKIESYDKEPTAFFGHICWTEDTDTLEEAKAIAKKYHDQGNIRVRVLKGSEEVFRYLEVTKNANQNNANWNAIARLLCKYDSCSKD